MENSPFHPRPRERHYDDADDAPEPKKSTPKPVVEPIAPVTDKISRKPADSTRTSRRLVRELIVSRRLAIIVATVVAIAAIFIAVWGLSSRSGLASTIDSKEYQALFLTNGQVYFGKLQAVGSDYYRLTDIFYLQSNNSTDKTNPQDSDVVEPATPSLIKLGNEIHGPEDEMVISKDQVLFFENLKPDGKVSQSISDYQKAHK